MVNTIDILLFSDSKSCIASINDTVQRVQGMLPLQAVLQNVPEGIFKIGKWYHFPLLANLYFDIPLRTKLV